MTKRVVTGITLALLILSILAPAINDQPVESKPTTWTVDDDGPADFTRIQDAINAATAGDTIFVCLGIYHESLVINKALTLIGEKGSRTRLIGDGSGIAILLNNLLGVTITYLEIAYWDQGILLINSSDCEIYDVILYTNVGAAINLTQSSTRNTVSNNTIYSNNIGLNLQSGGNTFYENTISQNNIGIKMSNSDDNVIYHNNFVENTGQVDISTSIGKIWDTGYPSGGNYWSDYTGVDLRSGPYQNETGSDGIGDSPYVIDADNVDWYPLINPWSGLPVHNLNTGLGYATIQEAINALETLDGHTIFVESGTYYEEVFANKALTLAGESRSNTIINGSGFSYSGALVEIIADHVDVSGFTVTNALIEGIRVGDSQYCEVHETTVCFTGDRGIVFDGGGNNKAYNNIVYNSSAYGGIEAIWSNNNEISHNIAYFNRWGIATNHGSNNLIFNNTVYSNREHGIHIDWPSTSNIILNNSITSNPNSGIRVNHGANGTEMSGNSILGDLYGIRIDDSFYNRILENNITNNTVGIDICASSNNTLSGNKMITNYNCSLMLSSSSSNVIFGNNIISSGDGITLGQVSENNRVYHNNFINSTSRQVHIYTPGYVNFWDDGYPSGGNYWSDYAGVDFYSGPGQDKQNEDGVGDTPYVIDENNQDNYPFMRPWPLERSTLHPWPMFHHDLRHTGYTESPAPNTNQTLWNFTTGGIVYGPVVAYGRVYVGGSGDKNVYCLDAFTGALVWNYTTGDWVSSSPAVVNGRVYVGSDDKNVYCLDALTGALIWNYTTGYWVFSSPAVADGKVYVGSCDNNVYCFDAFTGALVWNYTTGNFVRSCPAVVDGRVYVGSDDNKTYCLDALTGTQIWNYTTGDFVGSSPAVVDGRVYVGSYDKNVYCLDALTGALIWNYTTGSSVFSSPAVVDGKVYVGSCDNKTYCLDALTGAEIWNYTTGYYVTSSPAVADGKVYVGSYDFNVYCLNASTGSKIWSYTTGDWVHSSPAVADGVVYVGSDDHTIYAFGNVIRVPEDLQTIQEAINNATAGATIIVEPGIYNESIVINKTLTILGKKGSSTTFAGGGSGIAVTIQPTAPGSVVANVVITYYDKGIFVNDTRDCKIYDNIMSSMMSSGIAVEGNNAANNLIKNNIIYSNNIAINLTQSSTSNTLYNNTISLNNIGLNLQSSGNIIYGNTISENDVGIKLSDSDNNIIYWNSFVNTQQLAIQTPVHGNVWDNGYPAGGNYWSDYTGEDANSDGIGDTPYIIDGTNQDNYPLMNPIHEITVTGITPEKTVVEQGFSLRINIEIANLGRYGESFRLKLHAGSTMIVMFTDITLASRDSTTITFTWKTTGFAKGNYIISAVADAVPGEVHMADNSFTDGGIMIAMVGDVTGPAGYPDGKCDIRDIAGVAKLFGVNYPDPRYKPNYDITGPITGLADGKIDIRDVASIAKHFGETDP